MTNYSIAKAWLQAFYEHDLEKLLSLYDDQAEHFSPKLKIRNPETSGIIKGKNAMRIWWQDAFDRLPDLIYEEKNQRSLQYHFFSFATAANQWQIH